MKQAVTLPEGVHHIHCVGVGGSGMYPIIQILLSKGYEISGSDNNEGDILNAERAQGVKVYMGHHAENIRGADMIMYTAAVRKDNPELLAAQQAGIPILERAQVLGILSGQFSNSIGVTGTHGKTTVTSMLTQILYESGFDPSAVIGGKLKAIGGYGRAGKADLFVYEACEFQDHFLQTYPDMAVILNIDNDHLEYFGTIENAMKSYTKFAGMASLVLYNGDDPRTCTAMEPVSSKKYTFGFGETCDFRIDSVHILDGFTRTFRLCCPGGSAVELTLNIPGAHNLYNAAAAAAAALLQGVRPEQIAGHLQDFRGAGRRFELVGRAAGITIVDDYGHHPTEVSATLRAAKELGFKRVWAVFQPFTFSRTALLLDDFVQALSIADRVVLSPIMGAREVNTYGIVSADLGAKIPGCQCLESFEAIASYMAEHAEPGDLIVTMSCGDIYKCARMILHKLEQRG